MEFTRRDFVKSLGLAAALPLVPREANAALPRLGPKDRTLSFVQLHTGEQGVFPYMQGGRYVPHEIARLTRLMRDHYNGKVHAIDRGLFDLLHRLKEATGTEKPFEIISAYRSPETNAMLAGRSSGVASGSYHVKGQAIDIALADVPLSRLHAKAMRLHAGGVGYYPSSGFVHVDTGPVRRW